MMEKDKSIFTKPWVFCAVIVFTCIICYYNSIKTPFVFDDALITDNPQIRQLNGIIQKLSQIDRPLTLLSFMLNYRLGKLDTTGYHLFNIFMHTAVSILVFLLARKIVFLLYKKDSGLLPVFVALIFASHPVNTEVVTYIYNRSASLAAFFYLFSILMFIESFETKKIYYFLSLLAFILALFSKQTAFTLPVTLLAVDHFFMAGLVSKGTSKRILYHLPFWLILAGILLFQYSYLTRIDEGKPEIIWKGYSYYFSQPWVIVKYLQLLIFPVGLCIEHKMNVISSLFDSRVILPFILLSTALLAALKLYFKKTPETRIVLFSVLWFFITLIPTTVFKVHIGERHLYLPQFGFWLLAVCVFYSITKTQYFNDSNKIILLIMITLVFVFSIITIKRNQLYMSPELLWQDAVRKYPDNARAYNALGEIYLLKGECEKAIAVYTEALKTDNKYSFTYSGLGNAYYQEKNYDRAIEYLDKSIELEPDRADLYLVRGNAYNEKEEYASALADYNTAIKLVPDYAKAYLNRAILYTREKKYITALEDFDRALAIKPDYPALYCNRGVTYAGMGEKEKAIAEFSRAIELDPGYITAYYNRMYLYYEKKEYRKALEDAEKIQSMGYSVDMEFVRKLQDSSGKP